MAEPFFSLFGLLGDFDPVEREEVVVDLVAQFRGECG